MVPYQAPLSPISITQPAHPPLTRGTTLPTLPKSRTFTTDRTLLAPEDAIYPGASPPRRQSAAVNKLQKDLRMTNGTAEDLLRGRRGRHKDRNASSSRRRKATWRKLLWVKQSCKACNLMSFQWVTDIFSSDPDNYTDQDTFLEHLQRNPRLQPYDFWPLVADSTVIVQHVCSVIIFVVCFVGIFQDRVSPVSVVTLGSVGTILGWVLWDRWVYQEEESAKAEAHVDQQEETSAASSTTSVVAKDSSDTTRPHSQSGQPSLAPYLQTQIGGRHSHSASASSLQSQVSGYSPIGPPPGTHNFPNYPPGGTKSSFSPRNQQRLATAKSAVLIYCALLGLSPILKSLTKSTSSDSIWAMSCWLMIINVFFFDYRGGVGVKFPASLSTNAALMASTVLASRLPSTEHVFSLTLFSIEVFGLFPVFRRHLRHMSWRGHVTLTAVLVMGAGGGVGVVVSGGGWKAALVGVTLGNLLTGLAMGGASWWLIGLQKYKNEIHGPWDPARPIIRRQWDYID
jgi:phosphatidylinositol glycan class C protein